jgi:hypothetical protein
MNKQPMFHWSQKLQPSSMIVVGSIVDVSVCEIFVTIDPLLSIKANPFIGLSEEKEVSVIIIEHLY